MKRLWFTTAVIVLMAIVSTAFAPQAAAQIAVKGEIVYTMNGDAISEWSRVDTGRKDRNGLVQQTGFASLMVMRSMRQPW